MLSTEAVALRLSEFWFRRGPYIVAGCIAAVNALVFLDMGLWDAPRTAKLVLLSVDASALLGYAPAKRVVEYLWTPDRRRIVAVDSNENVLAGWEMTPEEFDEVEIDDGHLHQWEALFPTFEALDFDEEELRARATWKGTATDLQLTEYEEKVEDVHGELSALAEYGTTLRMRFLPFVRAASANQLEAFAEVFEDSTLPEGDAIRDMLERAKPEGLRDERERSKEIDQEKVSGPDEEGTPTPEAADRDSEGTPDVTDEVPADD